MGRRSTTPRNAVALADYLTGHPLVWICGLPGGAFIAAVSRIDRDLVEVTSVAGGRTRQILMPSGWNCRTKKPPVRTQAIQTHVRFPRGRVPRQLRRAPQPAGSPPASRPLR